MEKEFSKLKLSGTFLNPYEKSYLYSKDSAFFKQSIWDYATESGDIDMYIDALSKSKNLNYDDISKKYNLSFSNDDLFLNALYNEVYRSDKVEQREIVKVDDNGNEYTEKVPMSDYDYHTMLIKQINDKAEYDYKVELARQADENKTFWQKLGGTLLALPGRLVDGALSGVDDIVETAASLGAATWDSLANNQDWAESFGRHLSSDEYRVFQQAGGDEFDRALTELEVSTGVRSEVDGSYQGVGGLIVQAGSMVGKFIPAMAINMLAPGSGALVFYTASEFSQNYEQHYEQAKANNLNVDYTTMLITDAAISAVKYGLEKAVGFVFGSSAIERMAFGQTQSGVGKAFTATTKAYFARFGLDAFSEGTEEVLQDTMEILIHDFVGAITKGDYGDLSNFDIKDMVNTFLVAAIGSSMGSVRDLVSTKIRHRQSNGGYTLVDYKTGKTLNLFSQTLYDMKFSEVVSNINDTLKLSKKFKEGKLDASNLNKYVKSYKKAYVAANAISSIFNEIGETRSKRVIAALTHLEQSIDNGDYTLEKVTKAQEELSSLVYGSESLENEVRKSFLDRIRSEKISGIVEEIVQGKQTGIIGYETKEKLEKLAKDTGNKSVILTEEGSSPVETGDGKALVISEKAKNMSNDAIIDIIVDRRLIDAIKTNKHIKPSIVTFTDMYKKYKGKEDVTVDEVVNALYFDKTFFEMCLYSANAETMPVITSLIEMEKASVDRTKADMLYRRRIGQAIRRLKNSVIEYLKVQHSAPIETVKFLTTEDIVDIRNSRYANNLLKRSVMGEKLTPADITVIDNRVNSLPLPESAKTELLSKLKSDSLVSRQSGWIKLASHYADIYYKGYDGTKYMPNTSIPNMSFNSYLKNKALTISTLITAKLTKSEVDYIATNYGEVNKDTILLLRQEQFSTYTNKTMSFEFDDNGKIGIYNTYTGEQEGFTYYTNNVESNVPILTTLTNDINILKTFLNDKVDDITLSTITTTDVIQNPNLLKTSIKNSIKSKYSVVTPYTTYMYLRERVIKDSKGDMSITYLNDGTFGIVDISDAKNIFVKDIVLDKPVKISEFVDKKYVYGKLADTEIIVADNMPAVQPSSYHSGRNVIYVNSMYLSNQDVLKTSLVHEFQHAIQSETGMSLGYDADALNTLLFNKKITKKQADAIVDDIRKHAPKVFESLDKQATKPSDASYYAAASTFIYYNSEGELQAYGMSNSMRYKIVPVRVEVVNGNTIIRMPWGTEHRFGQCDMRSNFQLGYRGHWEDEDGNTVNLSIEHLYKFLPVILKDVPYYNTYEIDDDGQILSEYEMIYKGNDTFELLNIRDRENSVRSDGTLAFANTKTVKFVRDNNILLRYDYIDRKNLLYTESLSDMEVKCTTMSNIVNDIKNYMLKQGNDKSVKLLNSVFRRFSKFVREVDEDVSRKKDNPVFFPQNVYEDALDDYKESVYASTQSASAATYLDTDFVKSIKWFAESEYRKLLKLNWWKGMYNPVAEGALKNGKIVIKQYMMDNPDVRNKSIETMYYQQIPADLRKSITINDFLNMEIPVLRYQQNDQFNEDYMVSVAAGATGIIELLARHNYGDRSTGSRFDFNNVILGTIKVSDVIAYIPTYEHEALINPSKIKSMKKYVIGRPTYNPLVVAERRSANNRLTMFDMSYGYAHGELDGVRAVVPPVNINLNPLDTQLYVIDELEDKAYQISGPSRIMPEDEGTELASMLLNNKVGQLRRYDRSRNVTGDEWLLTTTVKTKKGVKKIYTNANTGAEKVVFDYSKNKSKGNRQVSKKSAGKTALKYYIGDQVDPNLQKLLKNANNDNAKRWVKKIKERSLVSADVRKDMSKGILNDAEFKLVNNSLYGNKYITTPNDLETRVANSARYWALYKMLESSDYSYETLQELSKVDVDIVIDSIISDHVQKEVFDDLVKRYSTKTYRGKDSNLDISDEKLRLLYMELYNGTLRSLYIAADYARVSAEKSKNISTSEVSLDNTVQGNKGDDKERSLSEVVADARIDVEDLVLSRYDATREMVNEMADLARLKIVKDGKNQPSEQAWRKWKQDKITKFDAMDIDLFYEYYFKFFNSKINADKNFTDNKVERTSKDIQEAAAKRLKTKRDEKRLVNNINYQVREIRSELRKSDIKKFLKDNSEYFEEYHGSIKLKESALNTNTGGKVRHKSIKELDFIADELSALKHSIKDGKYVSEELMEYRKLAEERLKELEETKKKNSELKSELKELKMYTFSQADRSFTVTDAVDMPESMIPLYNYSTNNKAVVEIKYLNEGRQKYTRNLLRNFIKDNKDYLSGLTQAQMTEIAEYLRDSAPMPKSNDLPRYMGIQIQMISYVLAQARDNVYEFDTDLINALDAKIQTMLSSSATAIGTWQSALKTLSPAVEIASAAYEQYGITLTPEQYDRLQKAFEKRDINVIQNVRSELYDELIKKNGKKYIKELEAKAKEDRHRVYKELSLSEDEIIASEKSEARRLFKHKLTRFLDDVLTVERAFMLSSPGTAIRNLTSNKLIVGLNKMSSGIGKLITNLFPKKQLKGEQWKITGTKVTDNVKNFIQKAVIDSKLFTIISSGVSKHDIDNARDRGVERTLAELMKARIAQDVFNNSSKSHKLAAFLTKFLSDEKVINKQTIVYFGKMLTEDGTTLTNDKGKFDFNDRSMELFVEAYVMAATDFMHKSNFMHKFEKLIRNRAGAPAYFMYKQFLPFAASAVNWFSEGLKYTPVGLVKSIINYAKLENTIDRLEQLRLQGERVIPGRFAKYSYSRDIGKGVIGTIGMLLGLALGLAGLVDIDDEDGTYKLKAGDTYVDISELFGTQGILLGISVSGGINKAIEDEEEFLDAAWDILSDTCNTLFEDSLYTSIINNIRYNGYDIPTTVKEYITYTIPNMFIPAFLKTATSVASKYNVKYSEGILGKIERLGVNIMTSYPSFFAKEVDIYTGETQVKYNNWFFINLLNKLGVIKFSNYNTTYNEQLAVSLGLRKSNLTGRYEIDGEEYNLNSSQVEAINKLYGKLNKSDIDELLSNRKVYRVQTADGKYKELKYSAMTDKQKANVIERIMNDNAGIAKIYALTKSGKYKYYADKDTFTELRKLGIKTNVYLKSTKLNGFVKIK